MTVCYIHDHANDDLEELFETDEEAAATILFLLEELYARPELARQLLVDFGGQYRAPAFHNARFVKAWRKGYAMYRVKLHDELGALIPYRILQAFHGLEDCAYILAIIERENAYNVSHPKVIRAFEDYDSLGIYRLPH